MQYFRYDDLPERVQGTTLYILAGNADGEIAGSGSVLLANIVNSVLSARKGAIQRFFADHLKNPRKSQVTIELPPKGDKSEHKNPINSSVPSLYLQGYDCDELSREWLS